jgi:hypothetical protein
MAARAAKMVNESVVPMLETAVFVDVATRVAPRSAVTVAPNTSQRQYLS